MLEKLDKLDINWRIERIKDTYNNISIKLCLLLWTIPVFWELIKEIIRYENYWIFFDRLDKWKYVDVIWQIVFWVILWWFLSYYHNQTKKEKMKLEMALLYWNMYTFDIILDDNKVNVDDSFLLLNNMRKHQINSVQRFIDLFIKKWNKCLYDEIYKLKRNESFEYETKIQHGESEVYYLLKWKKIYDKDTNKEKILWTIVDITNLKSTQNQLEDCKSMIEAIFENSPNIIIIQDKAHNVILTNMYWNNTNKLIESSKHWICKKCIRWDWFKCNDCPITEVFETWSVACQEIINPEKDYYKKIISYPILNNSWEIMYVVTTISDIKERVQNFNYLQHAKEHADNVSKYKSDFFASMSHDIRTPINWMIWMIKLLLGTQLTPIQKEYLDLMNIATKDLLKIVNEILDLSKIESWNLQLENNCFNFKKDLGDIHKLFSASIKWNVDFIIEIDPNIPDYIVWDQIRLKQIINNLISNSIKFTKDWYIKLKVNSTNIDDKYVDLKITVEDTWIWIDKDKIDQIFQEYKQEDNTITRNFGWTWLWMSIVKKLVEMMSWTVNIESEKWVWTKIELNIKLKYWNESKKLMLPQTIDNNLENFKWKKILIAEDDPVSRMCLEWLLQQTWHDVTAVSDWQQLIELFSKWLYDIVITDYHMPIIDWKKALSIIRDINPTIPVVVISASVMKLEKINLNLSGFDWILEKPFDLNILDTTILKLCKTD